MLLAAEFTIEPFSEGAPGPHVRAALKAAEATGIGVDVGPFGITITGEEHRVAQVLSAIVSQAVDNGATRLSIQVTVGPPPARPDARRERPGNLNHPLIEALEPVAEALGASIVEPGEVGSGVVALRWEGAVVGGLRLPHLHGALGRLISGVQREFGAPLSRLSREDKQRAVRMLDERGAFFLRKSVEDVADILGVSRFTIYNYLSRSQDATEERGDVNNLLNG